MKKSFILIFLTMFSMPLLAQEERITEAKVTDVTVYQQGAEVTRQTSIDLVKGETTLVFKELSSKIDARSIQFSGDNDLMIVSLSHSIDYLNEAKAADEIKKLEEERLALRDSLALIEAIKKVYLQEKAMILANKSIGGDDGVDINELRTAATFFRTRLTEIEYKLKDLEKDKYNTNLKIIQLSKQLNEWNSRSNLPTSVVKVVVAAKQSQRYAVSLKYTANDASWTPNYDLRIDDVDQPLALFYKAKVRQNTGEDWEKVKLILSTGNPSVSNYKPQLSTYYLSFNNYYRSPAPGVYDYQQPISGKVIGRVIDPESGDGIPGVNVIAKGTTTGTVTDMNGNYEIAMPPGSSSLVFSFIGYSAQEVFVSSNVHNVTLMTDVEQLAEVVVTGAAKKGVRIRGAASVAKPPKTEQVPLSIEKRETSTEFEIEIPYSIPSDNKQYDVTMVEYQVPVQYNYGIVPKLSDDAYLTARVVDWLQYEMVSGAANIFFQGIYQGETYLDLNVFEDTLDISVGRDKDIVVSREIQKDYSKKSTIGSTIKETKSWEITLKNNKDVEVSCVVEDQLPISKVSDIKVSAIEVSGAEVNTDDGMLKWLIRMQPNEKKTLIVKYEVRYPKGRNLIVD